jgi:hypothetical protein
VKTRTRNAIYHQTLNGLAAKVTKAPRVGPVTIPAQFRTHPSLRQAASAIVAHVIPLSWRRDYTNIASIWVSPAKPPKASRRGRWGVRATTQIHERKIHLEATPTLVTRSASPDHTFDSVYLLGYPNRGGRYLKLRFVYSRRRSWLGLTHVRAFRVRCRVPWLGAVSYCGLGDYFWVFLWGEMAARCGSAGLGDGRRCGTGQRP